MEIDFTELQPMPCGHIPEDHDKDALCPRHPRNEGFRLFSNSELRTFKRCRRKWWLQWYRGLQLKRPVYTGAAAIGNRLHRALQGWYVPEGQIRIDPRATLEEIIKQDWFLIEQSNEEDIPEGTQKKFKQESDLERAMIAGYMEWIQETGKDAEFEVIASETYLEVEITDNIHYTNPTKIIGKLDVRVKRKHDGVRQFMDHKTVQEFSTQTLTLPLDEQMLHYFLLEFLSTTEGEERCDAALYNMIRKVKRTAAAKPPFYKRIEITYNRHQIDSYFARLLETIEDIRITTDHIENGIVSVAYPNPTRDCVWDCPFFSVCGMFDDGSRVNAMLDQYYEKHDTLDYYMRDIR